MRRHFFESLIFFCCLIFLANSAFAITVEEIYRNFKAVYKRTENFSAGFEQITRIRNQKSTSKGRLIFGKPNLLRQEYFDPSNPKELIQLIILDGKTSWSYTPWLNQVTKTEAKGKELLPGIGKSLENLLKNYKMELVDDEVSNPKGIYQVKLSPKVAALKKEEGVTEGQSRPLEFIEVWIRSKDWVPIQFSYSYKSETNDMLVVTSLKDIKLNKKQTNT